MRPLVKPSFAHTATIRSAAQITHPAINAGVDALLLHYLGAYCAFSEEPLPDVNYVWHKRRGKTIDSPSSQDWNDVLLISPTTKRTQESKTLQAQLLYPDEDLTFRLDAEAPFLYRLEQMERTLLDEEGNPLGDPAIIEQVVVKPTTPAAEATVAFFALNTPYYNPSAGTLQIPQQDYYALVDTRMQRRTEVWPQAAYFLEQFANAATQAFQEAMIQQLRLLIAATGFWSTWATALSQRLADRTLLSRMLLPESDASAPDTPRIRSAAVGARTPQLPAGSFMYPGTRRDWLAT